jgi:hypothetical protein
MNNTTTYHGVVDLDGGNHYVTLTVDDKTSKDEVKKLMLEDAFGKWSSRPNAYVSSIESESERQCRLTSEAQFKANRPIMRQQIERKLSLEELKYIYFR